MTLAKRVQQLVEYSELSIPKFAEKVGFKTPQGVRELLKGTTKTLSDAAQYKIANAFPELNLTWLLTGEGEMLKQEPGQTVEAPRVPDDSQPCFAPLVDEMAAQRVMFQSELAAQRDLFKSTVDQLLALSQRLADTVNRLSEE